MVLPTDELFSLRLVFISAAPVPVPTELFPVALRTLVAEEFRVAPEFCLTEEVVLLLLFLTVADFLSALFLCVTPVVLLCEAEDLTAERVSTLF